MRPPVQASPLAIASLAGQLCACAPPDVSAPGRDTDAGSSGGSVASDEVGGDATSGGISASSTHGGVTGPGDDAVTTDDIPSSTESGSIGTGSTNGGDDLDGPGTTSAATGDGSTDTGNVSTTTGERTTGEGTTTGEASSAGEGTTTGEASSTGEGTTTGGGRDACDEVLWHAHSGTPRPGVGTDRFLTWGTEGSAVLRDIATLDAIGLPLESEAASIAGDRLVTVNGGSLALRDAQDAGVLAVLAATADFGLALDGSYVWTADATGLTVFDADGAEIWFEPGDYAGASVLALPGAVHAFAPGVDATSVIGIDLASSTVDIVAFDGVFRTWFADRARFATDQGVARRIYDTDGTLLVFDTGPAIQHGFGDWIVRGGDLLRLEDPSTPLLDLGSEWSASGATIATMASCDGEIIELADLDYTSVPFTPALCDVSSAWFFAASGDEWLVSLAPGTVRDRLDRDVATDGAVAVDGAASGRFIVSTTRGRTQIWARDEGCAAVSINELPERWEMATISEDGSRMFAADFETILSYTDLGVRAFSLPDGASLGFSGNGGQLSFVLGIAASDDGSVLAHHFMDVPLGFARVADVPTMTAWYGSPQAAFIPAVAPDGLHAARVHTPMWTDDPIVHQSQTYIYAEGVLVDIFDGVTFGFVANDRVLVGDYEPCTVPDDPCSDFVVARVLELDGTVVQETALPETPRFHRVTETEILVEDPPRIFDVYTGDLVWTDPAADSARPIGPDHLVVREGASLAIRSFRP